METKGLWKGGPGAKVEGCVLWAERMVAAAHNGMSEAAQRHHQCRSRRSDAAALPLPPLQRSHAHTGGPAAAGAAAGGVTS